MKRIIIGLTLFSIQCVYSMENKNFEFKPSRYVSSSEIVDIKKFNDADYPGRYEKYEAELFNGDIAYVECKIVNHQPWYSAIRLHPTFDASLNKLVYISFRIHPVAFWTIKNQYDQQQKIK